MIDCWHLEVFRGMPTLFWRRYDHKNVIKDAHGESFHHSVLKSGLYVTTDLHCRCVDCDHVQFISAGVLIHLLSDLSFYIRQYLSE